MAAAAVCAAGITEVKLPFRNVLTDSDAPQDVPIVSRLAQQLPSELVLRIVEATGDWELSTTLGLRHNLPQPAPWLEQATSLDWAVLRANADELAIALSNTDALGQGLSTWGARAMIKFSYTHLLDVFWRLAPDMLQRACARLLPDLASAWGRINVLDWAISRGFPLDGATEEAMDDASRHGHVDVLEWWKTRSGRELLYSDHALLSATLKGQIGVIRWWALSGLPLRLGRVLDYASMRPSPDMLEFWTQSGILEAEAERTPSAPTPPRSLRSRTPSDDDGLTTVHRSPVVQACPVAHYYSKSALTTISASINAVVKLDWWRASPYPLDYNKGVLLDATRMGRLDALDWWFNSGLELRFRWFDIDCAIEDAVEERRDAVAGWWQRHGFDSVALNAWGKTQVWSRAI